MLLCCEGKCVFSLQRFMPHNYSLNFNLAIISGYSDSRLFFFCCIFVNKLFSFLNWFNQKRRHKSSPFFVVCELLFFKPHVHTQIDGVRLPGSASSSLSVSNCCFIRAWKRNPWLHLIKRIGMADPHNQSQSLSNMLHSVTTKLAWRKVNYGPSLCSSAVILYRFCSCFHYANMDCVHLTHTAFFLFIQSGASFPF